MHTGSQQKPCEASSLESTPPPYTTCLGATWRLVLVSLQLLGKGLAQALVFDALQQRWGQEGLQAPLLPEAGKGDGK